MQHTAHVNCMLEKHVFAARSDLGQRTQQTKAHLNVTLQKIDVNGNTQATTWSLSTLIQIIIQKFKKFLLLIFWYILTKYVQNNSWNKETMKLINKMAVLARQCLRHGLGAEQTSRDQPACVRYKNIHLSWIFSMFWSLKDTNGIIFKDCAE